jgi:hypothetical protein
MWPRLRPDMCSQEGGASYAGAPYVCNILNDGGSRCARLQGRWNKNETFLGSVLGPVLV